MTRFRRAELRLGDVTDELWRYVDFPKFVSLLEHRALFFCRADLLGDPMEGSYTKRLLDVKDRYLTNIPPGRTLEEQERDLSVWEADDRAVRTCTFVNCWHVGSHESMAMWSGYGGGQYGVAIQSTVGTLDAVLPLTFSAVQESVPVELGRVRYLDYDSRNTTLFAEGKEFGHPIINFFHKSLAYSHEQEFRSAFFNIEALRVRPAIDPPPGYWVPVAIESLIQCVRVSPVAPPWFHELVALTLKRYAVDVHLQRSAVPREPIF